MSLFDFNVKKTKLLQSEDVLKLATLQYIEHHVRSALFKISTYSTLLDSLVRIDGTPPFLQVRISIRKLENNHTLFNVS
jgi:hypothetical protein